MIDRKPLRHDVIELVLEQIARGQLPPGRIVETTLSAELGVSRTPLREALVTLEQRGFLTSAMGRGFQIPPLSRIEAKELYALLGRLEPLAYELAAPGLRQRATGLTSLLDAMEATSEPAQLERLARSWTATLLEACPSRRLVSFLTDLYRLVARYERAALHDGFPVADAIAHHREILAHLISGNVREVSRLAEEAASHCLETLLRVLPEEPSADPRSPQPLMSTMPAPRPGPVPVAAEREDP